MDVENVYLQTLNYTDQRELGAEAVFTISSAKPGNGIEQLRDNLNDISDIDRVRKRLEDIHNDDEINKSDYDRLNDIMYKIPILTRISV